MLMLQLESVNQQGNTRRFTLGAFDVEKVLDMANSLIRSDHRIVNITLIDNGKAIKLPIAAFDGQPFEEIMRQLQNEWQLLLSKPIEVKRTQKQTKLLINLVELRIDRNEHHIAFLESTIVMLELHKSQLLHNTCEGSLFAAILIRNGLMIVKHHHFLANARERKEKNVQRLELLHN